MSTTATTRSELVVGVSGVLAGGGMVTMALVPLALPIIGLTLVAAIPLLLITLVGALAVAAVIVPVLLVLGLGRRVVRAARHTSATSSRVIRDRPSPDPASPHSRSV
jgi:hypothetical protein